jgi:hypothetical protein
MAKGVGLVMSAGILAASYGIICQTRQYCADAR